VGQKGKRYSPRFQFQVMLEVLDSHGRRYPTKGIEMQSDTRNSTLVGIDRDVLGISREKHHRFFLSRTEATCFLFRAEGQAQGYAYVWPDGQVGPLAAKTTESFRDISMTSLHHAAMRNPPQISILVPGTNRQAIEIAFNNHLEIVLPFVFFSSKPLPDLENYLLHSPGLM